MTKLEKLIQELCPDGVEFRPLEQCCNILDRKRKPVTKSARETGDYPYYGANGIQDYVSDYIFDGTSRRKFEYYFIALFSVGFNPNI